MIIKAEDWDRVGQEKKELLQRCEICRKAFPPEKLRARHLAYGQEVDDKYMIIVCEACNYNLYKAEDRAKHRLQTLNDNLQADIKRLYEKYLEQRDDITSDAMIEAVGQYRTDKRSVIAHLFRYPNLDGDDEIMKDARKRGVTLEKNSFNLMVKEKLDRLRHGTDNPETENQAINEINEDE